WLDDFQIPVAEGTPDKVIDAVGGDVEAEGVEGARHPVGGRRKLGQDPAIDGEPSGRRVEVACVLAAVHLAESGGVPELGGEVAVSFDALFRKLDVATLGLERRQREA